MKKNDQKMGAATRHVRNWEQGRVSDSEALVPVEVPLELWVDGQLLVTLHATPGHLQDLTCGFLLGQGLIASISDIDSLDANYKQKRINVKLKQPLKISNAPLSRTVVYSGCGQKPQAVGEENPPAVETGPGFSASVLRSALEKTLRHAVIYRQTRGIHSASLCSFKGDLLALREDIGRHNALDKVLGWAAGRYLQPSRVFVAASGRISSEAVDKLARFGIPLMIAKGVPTSLALAKANALKITLVSSLGPGRLRIYTLPERVIP